MISFRGLIFALGVFTLSACSAAKSPFGDYQGQDSTFAIYPDRVTATAELSSATTDSFGKPNAQVLHFSVCMENYISGQPIVAGTPFSISNGSANGSTEVEKYADVGGCIHWDETHAFSYFAPQMNIRVQRTIIGRGNQRGMVTLTFNVKPWLSGQSAVQSELSGEVYANALAAPATFGFNDSYPVDPSAANSSRLDVMADTMNFRYVEIGGDSEFSADSHLNISIPYHYTFSIQTMVKHQVFDGSMKSDMINAGRVRLTFVFFANGNGDDDPFQNSHYLTSAQVEGTIGANGQVSGTVVLKYPHMLFASGRQWMLIEVAPADDNTGVLSQTFSSNLSYIDEQSGITLTADSHDAEAFHKQNQQLRAQEQNSLPPPLTEFMAQHDVMNNLVTDFPPTKGQSPSASLIVTQDELNSALVAAQLNTPPPDGTVQSQPSVRQRLCLAYVAQNSDIGTAKAIQSFQNEYVATMQGPMNLVAATICSPLRMDEYVKIQQLDFVDNVGSPSIRNAKLSTYGNESFQTYTANEESKSASVGFDMSLRVPVWWFPPGFKAGFSDAVALTAGGTFSTTQTLAVDHGTMEINASVTSCVLITALQKPLTQKPWMICQPSAQATKWIPEEFFYFSQTWSSSHSPFIDPFNPETGLKLFVRGLPQMQNITSVIQNGTPSLFQIFKKQTFASDQFNVFVRASTPDINDFDTQQSLDPLTNQDVPGAFDRN